MVGVGAIDITGIVHRNAFERIARAIGDVGDDLAVQGRNADARRKLGISHRYSRRLIGNIEHVMLVDINPARLTELVPDMQQLAVLVEYLDGDVAAVGNINAAFLIDGETMRDAELII